MAIYLYSEDFADRFNDDQGLSDTTLVELNDTTTWMTEFVALFVGNPVEDHNINESDFYNNGYGVLKDAIVAYAEEELNGMFEFHMEYDSEGYLVDELKEERIIKAKAQDKLGYQLFRIYLITKNHENDNIIVKAQHITYDLANNFVESLIVNNMTKKQVMEQIGNNAVRPHPFNVTSTNNSTQSSTELYRTNPLQMIAGMQGSVLQIWGGQIERDNFHLIMHDRRGSDDGVRVMYKKNITGLEATFDISGLVTRIYPFVYIDATDDSPGRLITVDGKYIDSPLINTYSQVYIKELDYSSDDRIDTQDKTNAEIRSQLTAVANRYFNETGNDKRRATMEVAFEHLWETEEYKDVAPLELVGMGDTVAVDHNKLKVDATAIVNYIRYDCIAEINEEVKLGSVKARMSDSINRIERVEKEVEDVRNEANKAITSANGKNTTYYGPDEPTGKLVKGDTWYRVVDGQFTRTYRYDGIEWKLIFDMDSHEAKTEAVNARARAEEAFEGVENLTTVTESIGLRVGDLENPNLISHNKSDWDDIVTYHGLSETINIIENAEYTFEDFSSVKVDEVIISLEPSGKRVSVNPQGTTTFNSGDNTSLRFGVIIDDTNFLNDLGSEYKFKLVEGTEISEWSDGNGFSQLSQLRNAINLRVQKGDVLSQINVEADRILIDSDDKLVLSANTTYVTGDFKIDGSANIKDATIGTAQIGEIDAAHASIINLSADNIVSGMLTSQNNKVTFDLNKGILNIDDGAINITRPDGATWVEDGVPRFNFNVQMENFFDEGINWTGRWFETNKRGAQRYKVASFRHEGRYLKMNVITNLSWESPSNSEYMYFGVIPLSGNVITTNHLNRVRVYNNQSNSNTLTIDMGRPSYEYVSVYLVLFKENHDGGGGTHANNIVQVRTNRIWQEG